MRTKRLAILLAFLALFLVSMYVAFADLTVPEVGALRFPEMPRKGG